VCGVWRSPNGGELAWGVQCTLDAWCPQACWDLACRATLSSWPDQRGCTTEPSVNKRPSLKLCRLVICMSEKIPGSWESKRKPCPHSEGQLVPPWPRGNMLTAPLQGVSYSRGSLPFPAHVQAPIHSSEQKTADTISCNKPHTGVLKAVVPGWVFNPGTVMKPSGTAQVCDWACGPCPGAISVVAS
jgi:hypothetical protein